MKLQTSNRLNIKEYIPLIETIAKVEYKGVSSGYLIEYLELVNIGIQVIHSLHKEKGIESYNSSYISTAVKWAIRNEIRRRWRWYYLKSSSEDKKMKKSDAEDLKLQLREAVYKTILSIEEMAESENPTLIKDKSRNPEELLVFHELSNYVAKAMDKLNAREREFIENRFFKDKKLKDLAQEFNLSQSRISRIIQAGLDKIKKELAKKDVI